MAKRVNRRVFSGFLLLFDEKSLYFAEIALFRLDFY